MESPRFKMTPGDTVFRVGQTGHRWAQKFADYFRDERGGGLLPDIFAQSGEDGDTEDILRWLEAKEFAARMQ